MNVLMRIKAWSGRHDPGHPPSGESHAKAASTISNSGAFPKNFSAGIVIAAPIERALLNSEQLSWLLATAGILLELKPHPSRSEHRRTQLWTKTRLWDQ